MRPFYRFNYYLVQLFSRFFRDQGERRSSADQSHPGGSSTSAQKIHIVSNV